MDLRGRWDEADKFYQGIIGIYQSSKVNFPRGLILARAGMGNYQLQMKQYDRAESLLLQAVKDAGETGDLLSLCYSQYYLGVTYSKRGGDDKGMDLFEQALIRIKEISGRAEANHLAALINNQLGFIEFKRRQSDAALEYFHKSIDILKDAPNDAALGEAYRLTGDIHTERGQNAQGERALKKALDIFERTGATFEIARTYKSLGINLLNSGDLDKAAFFLDESIKILERLDIESELPMAYSSRAKVCIMKEEFKEAEALFAKDLSIAKKSDNKHSLAFSYYYIGRIGRLLARTHSAEDYLQRSLSLFNEVKNDNMAGHVMIELALCAAARKDTKIATDLCEKTRGIFESRRNSPELAELLLARGIILRDAKRVQMAQRCFDDCIRIHEKLNQPTLETAETRFEFAIFWRDQGKRKEATEHLLAAIGIAEKLGLSKRMNRYIALLNETDPDAGAKIQLSRFVDKATVDQISKGKSSAGLTKVDRKNLSVLFTDIRDFTTISETLDLDALASFLDDFYTNVIQAVNKYGGMLNKFIGDAAFAIFNIDGATKDHPEAAVRAAVELVRTINEVNLMRKRRGEIEINIGVGVNTGEVIVGSFGSSLRQDFTAIGDTVNTASRMQSQASHGEIVVSQTVYDSVVGIAVAEDMGEKPLKGKGQPLRLWKISGFKE
ncbi:MAG: tetratricopeptide repeat protein [bacterium]